MRNSSLDEAIRVARGGGTLAQTGVAQPSIASRSASPAKRGSIVETATDAHRAMLRSDAEHSNATASVDEVDAARAAEYALLAVLRGDATPLGLAHAALAEAASRTTAERVAREYFDLFIGLGRGELLPYGSYYLSGFLHERPLARLRHDLAELGIARAQGNIEPEDNAGTLCEVMAGIVGGRFNTPPGADRRVFDRHIKPW